MAITPQYGKGSSEMAGCWCHYPSRWGNFSMPLWTQQYCSITVQQYVIVLRSTMLTLCIRSTAYSSWSFSHCHTKILNQRASQCILDARWYSVPPRVTGPKMAIFVVTGNLSFRTSFDEAHLIGRRVRGLRRFQIRVGENGE